MVARQVGRANSTAASRKLASAGQRTSNLPPGIVADFFPAAKGGLARFSSSPLTVALFASPEPQSTAADRQHCPPAGNHYNGRPVATCR